MTRPTDWQISGNPSPEEIAAVVAVLSTRGAADTDAGTTDTGTGWAGRWRQARGRPVPRGSARTPGGSR